jgi:DNA-binding transcriptional LysR family regulator
MRNRNYADMYAFMAVAERRSFSRAARDLGVTKATMSESVRALETRTGVQLLHRTTRSVTLTESGERLLTRIRPLLTALDSSLEEIETLRDVPAGTLRLKVGPTAAHMIIAPLMAQFRRAYPAIRLEIAISHDRGDLVEGHYDAGIRIGFNIPRGMIAIPLSPDLKPVIIGAPSYFAEHPMPREPADLQQHSCVPLRLPDGTFSRWRFVRDGAVFDMRPSGSPVVDDLEMMLRCVTDGLGLAYLHPFWIGSSVATGRLVSVLEDWIAVQPGFHLYFPKRRQQPPALRAFQEFIVAPNNIYHRHFIRGTPQPASRVQAWWGAAQRFDTFVQSTSAS